MNSAHITEHRETTETWFMIEGRDCEISLEPRPFYCDRGNWVAKIHLKRDGDWVKLNLDEQDGWPRYYFDYDRAMAEIEAWLIKRKQMLPDPHVGPGTNLTVEQHEAAEAAVYERPPGHRTTLAKGMAGEETYILDKPPTPPVS